MYDQLSYISKDSADVSTRCIGCHVAKSKREPISKNLSPKPDHVMDVVHTDSWGPAPVETYGGHKYYVSFTDGCSGYTVIYLLKEHSSYEVFEKFQKYKALMENQTGRTIKVLRSDNGTEYKGPFTNRLEIWGIQPQTSNTYTPQQNGVSERINGTVMDTIRAFFHDGVDGSPAKNPDKRLWGEAAMAAVYLKNRLPSRVIQEGKTPYEIIYGKPADISRLRVWGSPVTVHIPKEVRKDKFDVRGIRGTFVGYGDPEIKGWRVAYMKNGKVEVIVSKDVDFSEEKFYKDDIIQIEALEQDPVGDTEPDVFDKLPSPERSPVPSPPPEEPVAPILPPPAVPIITPPAAPPARPPSPVKRSARIAQIDPASAKAHVLRKHLEKADLAELQNEDEFPSWVFASFAMEEAAGLAVVSLDNEPKTFVESQTRTDAKEWENAVMSEWKSLEKNETWTVVKKPEGLRERDIVSSRWVFKIKRDSNGNIERYKA